MDTKENIADQYKINGKFILNKETHTICLTNDIECGVVLSIVDIYNSIIQQKSLYSIPYEELQISKEILELKFNRVLTEIVFHIEIKSDYGIANYHLASAMRDQIISYNELSDIIENGYLIKNNNWYPVSENSIAHARLILEHFTELETLPINYSIDLFSKRENNRFVKFENDQLNLKEILSSKLYEGISASFVRELYDYQIDGLKWLKYCCINKIGGILGDDMGLGKTAQTIALISWIIERKIIDKNILIVLPSTLIENWKREINFFAPTLKLYVHHGTLRTGSITTIRNQEIIITSYSMIINDLYLFNKIEWGLILLDEASLIKNPNSERRIALSQLEADVRIAMSGTPVENSLLDLWSLANFVNPGYFGSIESFTAKYVKKTIEQTLNQSELETLRNETSFIMLRRKKEDVLDCLPEKIDIHQALEMNDEEINLYNDERDKILSKIAGPDSSNIFSLIQNLRQFTTHPLLLNHEELKKSNLNTLSGLSTKFKRTVELLDEIKQCNEKVLIFTEYLNMIDAFKRVLEERYKIKIFTIDGRIEVTQRQINIDDFTNQNGFSIMLLNPKTAGMGLNITAANHVIHYTRQWNPALEEQASARVYRNKQTKNVNVYYLYYIDTIEEIIDSKLRAKSALSGEVIAVTDSEITIEEYLESLTPKNHTLLS